MAKWTSKPKKAAQCRVYDLRMESAAFSAPDAAMFPALAPKRYVPVSSSDPTPRVRLVKDVIRLGDWQSPNGEFNATSQVLVDLAANFTQCLANGYEVKLCWGHGEPNKIGTDPRNLISNCDQAFVQGDVLYVTSYVPPQTAIDLQNSQAKVSARVGKNFTDGAGNFYPIALLHVAVVDHPVIGGQSDFLDLGANPMAGKAPPFTKKKPAAKPDPNAADAENPAEDAAPEEEADPQEEIQPGVIPILREYLISLGSNLPDETTPENLEIVLKTLLSTAPEEEEPVDDAPADPGLELYEGANDMANNQNVQTFDLAQLTAAIETAVAPFKQQITDLSNEITALKSDKATQAKASFENGVEGLLKTGKLLPANKDKVLALGAKQNYDLGLLELFVESVVDLSSLVQKGATAAPPKVEDKSSAYTKPDEATHKELVGMLS